MNELREKNDVEEITTKISNNIHYINKFRPGLLDKILVSILYHF